MIALSVVVFTIGVAVGYYIACTLKTGKQADEEMQPPPNPTKLLTPGGVVTWQGETFAIERFAMGEDNQTDAIIKNDSAMLCVPVEELEAVRE